MNSTVKVFKDRLEEMLATAKRDIAHFKSQNDQDMESVCFGRADALHEIIALTGILEK